MISVQIIPAVDYGLMHHLILTFSAAKAIISPLQLREPTWLRGNNHDSFLSHFSPNNKPFLIQLGSANVRGIIPWPLGQMREYAGHLSRQSILDFSLSSCACFLWHSPPLHSNPSWLNRLFYFINIHDMNRSCMATKTRSRKVTCLSVGVFCHFTLHLIVFRRNLGFDFKFSPPSNDEPDECVHGIALFFLTERMWLHIVTSVKFCIPSTEK